MYSHQKKAHPDGMSHLALFYFTYSIFIANEQCFFFFQSGRYWKLSNENGKIKNNFRLATKNKKINYK